MAFTFDLANNASWVGDAMLQIKNALKANGATVEDSGDGNGGNYGSGADILTVASVTQSTANNIYNNGAWYRMSWPNGREIVVKKNAVAATWAFVYSAAAGFTNGVPAATVPPEADDQQFIVGTSMSVGGGSIVTTRLADISGAPTTGRQVIDMAFGGADEDYAFYCLSRPRGQENYRGGFFIDVPTLVPAYREDSAVVGVLNDDANWFSFEGVMFDGRSRPTGGSSPRVYGWAEKVASGAETTMQACCILQWLNSTSTGWKYADPTPSLGLIPGASPLHGGYDVLGRAQWLCPGRPDNMLSASAYLGKSRLFYFMTHADAVRDWAEDLTIKFAGPIGVIWDGSTDPLL
jgi:hypothetical protein